MKTAIAVVSAVVLLVASETRERAHNISADDLRVRLDAFANDSMLGRATGTEGSRKASQYIASELQRLSIASRGDSAGYFQAIPLRIRQLDLTTARMTFRQTPYLAGADFLPITTGFGLNMPTQARIDSAPGWRAGRIGEKSSSPSEARGKVISLYPPRRPNGQPDYQLWNVREQVIQYKDARAILIGSLELMPRSFVARLTGPRFELAERVAELPRTPPIIAVKIPDMQGYQISLSFESRDSTVFPVSRNVIAWIEGSDPSLKSEFVVLSAHTDHLGVARADERAGADSVYNGADDGGTGSVALLEIAKYFAISDKKPRRSLVFVWTAAHEDGLLGAEFFADHPTIPRDRIIASIVLDNIGRGGSRDITGGGDAYLEVHDAHGLASELREWIGEANNRLSAPFAIATHPVTTTAQYETCDGDDWHLGRWGIPSVRLSTGRHSDYHTVSDQSERINYAKLARVAEFVAAVADDLANRANRPRVSAPVPDPRKACVMR